MYIISAYKVSCCVYLLDQPEDDYAQVWRRLRFGILRHGQLVTSTLSAKDTTLPSVRVRQCIRYNQPAEHTRPKKIPVRRKID